MRLLSVSVDSTDNTNMSLCLSTSEEFKVNDCIRIDPCLYWYNEEDYHTWFKTFGCKEKEDQCKAEDWYCDQLAQNVGASKECLDNLKKEYIRKQVKFSYPVLGHPQKQFLVKLNAYLSQPQGHIIDSIDSIDSNKINIKMNNDMSSTEINYASTYKLLTGIVHNISNSTNISMTVYTRDEDDVVLATNI